MIVVNKFLEGLKMLRTNSTKAKNNIKQYIINNFDCTNYTDAAPEEWRGIATFILETFRTEKYSCKEDYRYYGNCEFDAFTDWCAGLPSVLDTCYYYNRSAIDDLAAILEETEEEKARFTEDKAEWLLTYLIYSKLIKEEKRK
jgi:hypothetical protein